MHVRDDLTMDGWDDDAGDADDAGELSICGEEERKRGGERERKARRCNYVRRSSLWEELHGVADVYGHTRILHGSWCGGGPCACLDYPMRAGR